MNENEKNFKSRNCVLLLGEEIKYRKKRNVAVSPIRLVWIVNLERMNGNSLISPTLCG